MLFLCLGHGVWCALVGSWRSAAYRLIASLEFWPSHWLSFSVSIPARHSPTRTTLKFLIGTFTPCFRRRWACWSWIILLVRFTQGMMEWSISSLVIIIPATPIAIHSLLSTSKSCIILLHLLRIDLEDPWCHDYHCFVFASPVDVTTQVQLELEGLFFFFDFPLALLASSGWPVLPLLHRLGRAFQQNFGNVIPNDCDLLDGKRRDETIKKCGVF